MAKYQSRADLLIAAGESIKMQENAGIDPVFKSEYGIEKMDGVGFTLQPDRYEFPLAVVEGKPVFVGDELYWDDGRNVTATELWGSHSHYHRMTWNQPKPKTVTIEMIVEDAVTMLGVIDIYQEYCANKGAANRVHALLDKALKALEKA